MGESAFAATTIKRLDLTGPWEGEWVDVKEHLGVVDQKRIDGAGFTSLRQTEGNAQEAEAGLDLGRLFMTRLKVYIVAWSFTDAQGAVVPVTASAIDTLKPECADEINDRLSEWRKEVAAAKGANPTKPRSGGTPSSPSAGT